MVMCHELICVKEIPQSLIVTYVQGIIVIARLSLGQ